MVYSITCKILYKADIMKFKIDQLNSQTHTHEDSDEHRVRLAKVQQMRELGIEPWPASLPVTATAQAVHAQFQDGIEHEYELAGRLMTIRAHGKTVFGNVQDRTGTIQIYLRMDEMGQAAFEQFGRFVDMGDIVWVKGTSFRTKMGEITLKVRAFSLLSKSLYPLPEKFHGLTDVETKYRQRYLDLMSNPESKSKFIKRSKLISSLRAYLDKNDFVEVETPMLHPIAGGAAARPFVTHHNALDSDFYLRIAPELYLKRLVVGGIERVYEINRNFRNEGLSTRHNPEFTMVEFYMAYQDYHFIMDFVEQLLRTMIFETTGLLQTPFGTEVIDFAVPFKRISVYQSVLEYGHYTPAELAENTVDAVLAHHAIQLLATQHSYAQKIYALFEKVVEPHLVQPTFIIDYPIEISPLSKRDASNPSIAARFELFIGGMEISNGFNELNDPLDQANRFKQQLEAHKAGDAEAHQYDADYILALEHALAPTVGVGIGIDRVVMLATNTTSIKDVILFPTLKKK